MPHVRSVAVGIWVETGSRVEPDDRGGISHLIEHLVFKGTATRSAEEIAGAIDSVGGPDGRLHRQGAHLLLRERPRRSPDARRRSPDRHPDASAVRRRPTSRRKRRSSSRRSRWWRTPRTTSSTTSSPSASGRGTRSAGRSSAAGTWCGSSSARTILEPLRGGVRAGAHRGGGRRPPRARARGGPVRRALRRLPAAGGAREMRAAHAARGRAHGPEAARAGAPGGGISRASPRRRPSATRSIS